MTYLAHIVVISAMLWMIGRKQGDPVLFFIAAGLKLAAGVVLGLIFKYYYQGGDTMLYYSEAQSLIGGGFWQWWEAMQTLDVTRFSGQPRAEFFAKIVSVVALITQGDYWIVSLYFSIISFLGYWYFFCQVSSILPQIKWPVAFAFLFLPSTVFWSSGIMKGSLLYSSAVWLAAFTMKLIYRKKMYWGEYVATVLSLGLIFFLAYYLFILLIPVLAFVFIEYRSKRVGFPVWIRITTYGCMLVMTYFLAPKINPNLKAGQLPKAIYRNQVDVYMMTESNSAIDLNIEPTWGSLLAEVPSALFAGLYGPMPWHTGSVWSWVPKVENCLLALLSFWSIALLIRQKLWEADTLVLAMLAFILILAIILPLAAPNFGSLARYKACYTPFLALLVSVLPYGYWLERRA
jgi:hypothetical protein